ncbi:prepilin peptidase [Staphylococcus taiwanensis]|nr:prepilin peptidase [Staphylococcus taiwanensis]
MILLSYLCSIIFSFLYQFNSVEKPTFNYFLSRSKCDYCCQKLKWLDLLPIINFILLKGRSSCCKQKLKRHYIFGEILAFLAIPIIIFYQCDVYIPLFISTYLILLTMAIYDIETYTVNLNLLIIFFIINLFLANTYILNIIIFSSILHLFFFLLPNQIGYGDIILFSMLSMFYPYYFFLIFLNITFILATIYILITKICINKTYLPLIPFIFTSYIITSYCYHHLVNFF